MSRAAEPLPLGELAAACRVSERTPARMFVAATGRTPLRYQRLPRLARAEVLVGQGETVEAAAARDGVHRRPDAAPAPGPGLIARECSRRPRGGRSRSPRR